MESILLNNLNCHIERTQPQPQLQLEMISQWFLRVALVSVFSTLIDAAGHLDHLPPPPPPLIQAEGMKKSETILPPPPPDRPPPFPQQKHLQHQHQHQHQHQQQQQQQQQYREKPAVMELQRDELDNQIKESIIGPSKQIPPPPPQGKDPAVATQTKTPYTEASQYHMITPPQQLTVDAQNGKGIERKIHTIVQQPMQTHPPPLYHNAQHGQPPPQLQAQQGTNNAHAQRGPDVGPAYRPPMYARDPLPQRRRSQSLVWKS